LKSNLRDDDEYEPALSESYEKGWLLMTSTLY
jgi:hypothetical protein